MNPADQVVARFMKALRESPEPELQTIALMIQPHLLMMGDKSGLVTVLDRAAELWAAARGGRFDVEVAA